MQNGIGGRVSPGLAKWLAQIDRAMETGNALEASRLARSALDFGYVHPALFNLRAHALRLEGRIDDALADLRRALELSPRSAWTFADMADCLNAIGRWEEALAAANAATSADRRYSRAWFQKGLAQQALLALAAARESYLRAVQIEPTLADAHARLANMAAEQGAFAEARRHADAALAAVPGHPMAAVALVTADMREDRLTEAEQRLGWLLSRADVPPPMRAVAIAQLGDLRDAQGRIDEAFAAYCNSRAVWAGFHVAQMQSTGLEPGRDQILRLGAVLDGAPLSAV